MTAISIEIDSGKEGFYQIENEWKFIVDRIRPMHLFYTYPWYKSWVQTIEGDGADLVFLLMYRAGTPIAIFPLKS